MDENMILINSKLSYLIGIYSIQLLLKMHKLVFGKYTIYVSYRLIFSKIADLS